MATYQKDITRNVEPAMANPATLMRSAELKSAAVGGAIKSVAGTLFDAYAGYQTAGLKEDLKSEVSALQGEMDSVKQADISAKATYETETLALPSMVDEFKAASLLAGADPEEVRASASVFGKQNENAIVARYRAEQQKIMAARDALPERYNEFMNRSEKVLKQYIANTPGLANSFRKVSEEVTGKQNLELYSVSKLYEDVNFIEKQKEQRAKQYEQAQQALMTAYVDDRVKGGASKTQAMAEFNAVTPDQRLELANASVQVERSKADAKAALELGGNNILNYATITIGDFNNVLISKSSSFYAQVMSEFKVSRADLASGNIPDAVINNPRYKELLNAAGTNAMQLLDAQYTQAVQELNTKARTTPADADKVKVSMSLLDSWYKEKQEYYSKNATSWLTAVASKDDRESTVSKRLNIVDTMVRSLGIPADVVAQLGMSGDTTAYNTARGRYPRAAAIIDHANMMREKVLSGVTTDEFMALLGDINKYKVSQVTTPPVSNNERLASLSVNKQLQQTLKTEALTGITPTTSDTLSKYVASSFHDPANTEQVLGTGMTIISNTLSKLPESERQAVISNTTNTAAQMIYSEFGHGNKAKAAYLEFANSLTPFSREATTQTTFVDATGNAPLKLSSKREPIKPITRPDEQARFNLMAVQVQPTKTNNVLSAVDDMLRIQSTVTGAPIQKLRQDFIKTFNIRSAASVSETYTSEFERATTAVTPTSAAPTSGSLKAGDVVNGYTYSGGNPNVESSWSKK